MSNFIGPALPPHLQKKLELSEINETNKVPVNVNEAIESTQTSRPTGNSESVIGPTLPLHLNHPSDNTSYSEKESLRNKNMPNQSESVGPALPPSFRLKQTIGLTKGPELQSTTNLAVLKETDDDDEDNSVLVLDTDTSDEESYKDEKKYEMYGPILPPNLRVGLPKAVVGPNIPPGMKLPADVETSDSDTDIVGPMPIPEGVANPAYIQEQLDDRALRMKRKLAGEDCQDSGSLKRENWMLELPPDRAADFGLGPRQFRTRAKPDSGDRSVWTDTPADRLKKKKFMKEETSAVNERELQEISDRDKEMQRHVEKHSGKKRQESLLEAHQKELRKKRKKDKEDGKREERRPFDRDIDLQANRFDEAQKKNIFKKAQLLNDRFSSGQSKFL